MKDIDRWDVCVMSGALLLAVGCGLWSLPFGIVVAGVELVAVGLYGARHLPDKIIPSHEPRSLEG